MKKLGRLFIAVIVCQLAGFLGSLATTPAINSWYKNLKKPSFTPPNWLFGPVWLTLYFMMALAAYLIWNRGLERRRIKQALLLFALQLVLNTLWSFIFFGFHQLELAFFEIMFLWILILLTMSNFYKISRPAGLLLLPYLLWVSFAAFLNFSIFLLNRGSA